jgi:hypothetical protein
MQRKHAKQMSRTEMAAVRMAVAAVPSWVSRGHYAVRGRERSITRREVYEAILFGLPGEVNDKDRVVMRHASGVCVVVELPTHTVVTVWYNDPQDQHWTLDISQYRWTVNLVEWSRAHGYKRI